MSFLVDNANRDIVERNAGTTQLFIETFGRQARNAGGGFRLTVHCKEFRPGNGSAQFVDPFGTERSAGLKKASQTGQFRGTKIRAPQQDIEDGGNASKSRAAIFIDCLKDFIRKHKSGIENDSAALKEMSMQNTSAKAV